MASPPNPPFQPTAAREIVGFLTVIAMRLRRLNGNPLGALLISLAIQFFNRSISLLHRLYQLRLLNCTLILIAFNQVYRRIGIWKSTNSQHTNPNYTFSLPLMKGHLMNERARPIIRILLSLMGVLIICAPLWFYVWPLFALYGYAPLIFSTSPSLSNSELLGKTSAVVLECHKTWIWGYYATDAPWADVMTFYRTYGYQPAAPNNDYVSRQEPHLVRQVNLFDKRSVVIVHDEPLRTNLAAAFSKGRTVYSFSLVYTEHEESFQTRNCPGD